MVAVALRIAAILLAFTGLGFGIPGIFGARHLAAGNGVWTFMGFPAYGGGPFERMGIQSTPALLYAFVAVCALEVVAAVGLWIGARWAAILTLALLPFGATFWYGFALPIPWIAAGIRTVLVVAQWQALR